MRKIIIALFAAFLIPVSVWGQDDKVFRVGVDASVDGFISSGFSGGDRILIHPSYGLGVRARLGRYDQWFNLVSGVRYIYGTSLSGFQVPILLNLNLLKGPKVSAYVGGGFEFDFIGTYWGAAVVQAGLAGRHVDFRVFYKSYQGDVGAGFTYYF